MRCTCRRALHSGCVPHSAPRSPNADRQVPRRFPPREIRPEECGLEVRGGGNATRQIIDILPPAAAADRLLVCEVLTPAGNWSSYPPHKHDRHAPPVEADLEETYYYRFSGPDGYGIQRLYTADGRSDQTLRVTDGDLVLVRDGYHPFVAAPGFDAYYLNTLAGSFRSMAATDDPRYAHLRANWPPPDPRVPMIPRPAAVGASSGPGARAEAPSFSLQFARKVGSPGGHFSTVLM